MEELKPRLVRGNFNILNQILNFDGKVIGLFIQEQEGEEGQEPQMSGTIMCEPSAVDPPLNKSTILTTNHYGKHTMKRLFF